jgi:hypothetical protein
MKKTLAIILHYNTPEVTEKLYGVLKPHEGTIYDLKVMDNDSDEDKKFEAAEIVNKKNLFFGGGLQTAFDYFRKNNSKYDSLLFLNSDLVVFGPTYVSTLRKALFDNPEYKIISPALVGDWNSIPPLSMHKHMNSWGATSIRPVKYVDFETPLFHGDFVNQINYPSDLMFGIGQDHLSGLYCEERGWKIGVIDWMNAFHYWAYTIRSGKAKLNLETFAHVSNQQLFDYVEKHNLMDWLQESFKYGVEYEWGE